MRWNKLLLQKTLIFYFRNQHWIIPPKKYIIEKSSKQLTLKLNTLSNTELFAKGRQTWAGPALTAGHSAGEIGGGLQYLTRAARTNLTTLPRTPRKAKSTFLGRNSVATTNSPHRNRKHAAPAATSPSRPLLSAAAPHCALAASDWRGPRLCGRAANQSTSSGKADSSMSHLRDSLLRAGGDNSYLILRRGEPLSTSRNFIFSFLSWLCQASLTEEKKKQGRTKA